MCSSDLGRTDGPGEGQLQYQIRPAPDGGLRPGVTAYQRKVTPLDKIAAHGANNGGVFAKLLPDGLYQGEVTIMQGIIFCYDTSGFHVCHLKAVTKKCQFGKNGDCISRKFCYNEIREFA